MKDEIFKVIPSPNDVSFDKYGHPDEDTRIGELGGLLCVFFMPEGENVQIWVMEEYGEANSWTKKFITHEEEILLQNRKNGSKLILYNPKTSSVRNKEFGFKLYNAFICTRSILSPTLIRGARDTMT
ncbi:hypothetical protein FRX31_035357 [Thalictrum thalictroides]|uniref:F-box associated domain-containing protein n=1 Tax=Thalictrum thalictroides TaxID=46969 RepID=A0A7J6URA6_THATH|nr:hypothetical protein FRX31_035357 [Thalictrum thalictroides]